jgi:hypothetical protein
MVFLCIAAKVANLLNRKGLFIFPAFDSCSFYGIDFVNTGRIQYYEAVINNALRMHAPGQCKSGRRNR